MKLEDFLNALPTKDDLAQTIGLQTRPSASSDLFAAFGVFGAGLLLGAGLALLFAPTSGPQLRNDIASKVNELGERIGANIPTNSEDAHRAMS